MVFYCAFERVLEDKEKKETATDDGFLVFTIDGNTKHFGTYDKAIVEALAGYKIQMPTDWVPVYD